MREGILAAHQEPLSVRVRHQDFASVITVLKFSRMLQLQPCLRDGPTKRETEAPWQKCVPRAHAGIFKCGHCSVDLSPCLLSAHGPSCRAALFFTLMLVFAERCQIPS